VRARGKAVEINSSPERLDLTDAHARRAAALGIRNLFVCVGDPVTIGDFPQGSNNVDVTATGLLALVNHGFNLGRDRGGSSIGEPTSFFAGAAVAPIAVAVAPVAAVVVPVAPVAPAIAASVIIHSIKFQKILGLKIEMLRNSQKHFPATLLDGVQPRIRVESGFGGPAEPRQVLQHNLRKLVVGIEDEPVSLAPSNQEVPDLPYLLGHHRVGAPFCVAALAFITAAKPGAACVAWAICCC